MYIYYLLGINDLEEVSRIVRTLTVLRPDSIDSNTNSIQTKETKLHIRKGAEDMGIDIAVNNDTGKYSIYIYGIQRNRINIKCSLGD